MPTWEERLSASRQIPYYFNRETGETQWERPHDFVRGSTEGSHDHQCTRVHAYHLLVKHAGSRRPSSWREPVIGRTRDQALDLISGYRREIVGGQGDAHLERFKALAGSVSDCSSAKRGGDLGEFSRGQMQRPFEEAAFSQPVDQVGEIVETDSGLHLIYVASRH